MTGDRFELAVALLRDAPLNLPPPSRREEVRTAVLSTARLPLPASLPRRRVSLRVAVGLVMAAAASIALWPSPPTATAPHVHATVTGDGRFTRVSSSPDEIVRLEHGTIAVSVAPLHAGERFRVIVGDAEVEVRGTAFTVTAAEDTLLSVDVSHGKVEVRPHARPMAMLVAGDTWRAPRDVPKRVDVPPAPPEPAPQPPPPPPRKAKAPAKSLTVVPARAPESLAYDEAWTAMRAKDYATASTRFARVVLLAPDGALVEDAAFWQAVALARATRRAQAITAFRDFLDAHPRSPHAGEASAMLGWLLLDSGERAEAERRFRAAANDPNTSVRDSARSGLDAATQ